MSEIQYAIVLDPVTEEGEVLVAHHGDVWIIKRTALNSRPFLNAHIGRWVLAYPSIQTNVTTPFLKWFDLDNDDNFRIDIEEI